MRKRGSSRDDAALPVRAIPVRAEQTHAVRTGHDRVGALDDRRLANAVLESSGLLIVMLDLESRVVRSNRAYRELAGLSDAAVAGQPFPMGSDHGGGAREARQHAAFAAWFGAVVQSHDQAVWEQTMPDTAMPQRAMRRIDWRGSRMLGADGQPDGVLLVGVDVTEQRAIENEARRRRADAWQHADGGTKGHADEGVEQVDRLRRNQNALPEEFESVHVFVPSGGSCGGTDRPRKKQRSRKRPTR